MCAACVAQGIAYVGGALGSLQVMAARAKARRTGVDPPDTPGPSDSPEPRDPAPVAAHH
jgi:hypothetical protein